MRARALLALALPVLWLASTAAALDPGDARRMLHLRAGATCLRADDLAAEIPRWLEDDALATDVEVWVEGSDADARVVTVRLLRGAEEVARREFRPGPEGCTQLRSAVGLSIAMALRASVPEPSARPRSPRPRARVGPLDVVLGGVAAFGLLRRFVAGPEVRLQLGIGRHLAVRVAGVAMVGRDLPLREASLHFDAFLTGARADACARATLKGPLEAHLCAGGLGGVLRTRSEQRDVRYRSALGWAAFTGAVGLRLSSRHWLLSAEPGLLVPLRRVRIGVVDSEREVVAAESVAAVALSLALGAGYRF